MSDTATAVEEREVTTSRSSGTANLITKMVLVGLIDALLIWAIAQAFTAEWWPAVVFFALALVAINVVYFSKRSLPMKYLLPGLLFLLVYQLFTMIFTGYASFTNYGTGHLDSKEAAIIALEQQSVSPIPGAPEYPVVPIVQDDVIGMLVTDPTTGLASIGTSEALTPANPADVTFTDGKAVAVNGWTTLNLGTLTSNPDYDAQWSALVVPLNEDTGSFLRPISIGAATEAQSGYVYDEQLDAMVDTKTGETFPANGETGSFVSESGKELLPGWIVGVGWSNYTSLFTDPTIRARFLPITGWTFFFAIATTFLNFSLGLLLAMVMSERRMKWTGGYRLLLIVPYALPSFMTMLLWRGMLNTDFGLINQILPGALPWLTDTTLARFSLLMVNLWLGFPYFLLVCSGALTAIPADLKEAAYVDGAGGLHTFRTIVLPLLLISTAPLLVTTFAFNFNNYNLIELVTGGGPFEASFLDGGNTDLLINYTLRKAFNDSNQQLGLASAISLVIFIIVGTVSTFGFRLTKKLEEIGR